MKKTVQCFSKQLLFIGKYILRYDLRSIRLFAKTDQQLKNRYKITLSKLNVKNL